MKIKKYISLLITVFLLLSIASLASAAETVTLGDQISITNVLREESPMLIENVPIYVCQAPVTVALLQDSTVYTVSDLITDDEGSFSPSAGYLPDGGTNDAYWDYEKNKNFPKNLSHTLTGQTNPYYVKSTAKGKTVEAIILINSVQPMNPANKSDGFTYPIWEESIPNGSITINGLYDITYNKKGDTTFIIDQNSTITVNCAASAVYVDNRLFTEAADICTVTTCENGTYKDNQFWYDESSATIDQTYLLPGSTFSITEPGDHTVTVSLGYQSKEERLSIQGGDSLSWQDSPRISFRVINATPTANYTTSKVLIDGNETAFEAYNIEDNNYFKLRDIAKVISGSSKQFEVSWDDENSVINLISGKAYTAVGGELSPGDNQSKPSVICTSKIFKDGTEVILKAYNIGGNNYFKLRDLGQAFNFDVSWDGSANCITVETDKAYTAD